MSLCRLFIPHGLILYFDVSKFIPKNTCLFLYMTFNPILACTRNFLRQIRVHQDVCINPNIFRVFFHACPNNLTLGLLLPPKLYLVVFYQVSLVNQTRITCSDFRRPLEVLLGSACCTISHVHTPWGNCNKCSSMIVSVKDSVS